MAAWFIVTWVVPSMEMSDRPGWVAQRSGGLAGLTSMPLNASRDLYQAGYDSRFMALGLWASTLSRSILTLWGVLFLIGGATCWARMIDIVRSDEVTPVSWLWLFPLLYLSFRATVRLVTPCHTLPHCVSLLEFARIQWWRRFRPFKYLGQSFATLFRHFVMFAVVLLIAGLIGAQIAWLYRLLPFDINRPVNLLIGGVLTMLLGAIAAFLHSRFLERRKERYLERAAELVSWLLEEDRAHEARELDRDHDPRQGGIEAVRAT